MGGEGWRGGGEGGEGWRGGGREEGGWGKGGIFDFTKRLWKKTFFLKKLGFFLC